MVPKLACDLNRCSLSPIYLYHCTMYNCTQLQVATRAFGRYNFCHLLVSLHILLLRDTGSCNVITLQSSLITMLIYRLDANFDTKISLRSLKKSSFVLWNFSEKNGQWVITTNKTIKSFVASKFLSLRKLRQAPLLFADLLFSWYPP